MLKNMVLLASMAFSAQALATSTMLINCTAKVRTQTGFWIYDFQGQATYNRSLGFVSFQKSPILSVTKITKTPKGPVGTTFVEGASLKATGAGASYLAFELPESVLGLSVNYYPDSSVDSAGTMILFHEYAPGQTIVTEDNEVQCWAEEIG